MTIEKQKNFILLQDEYLVTGNFVLTRIMILVHANIVTNRNLLSGEEIFVLEAYFWSQEK